MGSNKVTKKNNQNAKNEKVTKKVVKKEETPESSSDSSASSSSSSESSASESSDSEEEEEKEEEKKEDESSSSSDEESSAEEKSSSEEDSSSDEEEEQEEEEEKEVKKEEESSEANSDDSSSSSSDDEEENEEDDKTNMEVDEESSSDSNSSSSEDEEEEEKMEVDEEKEKKNKKRKADTSDDDKENPAKAAKTEDKFTVWCGGINWEATVDQIKEYFGKCGEIVDVRLRMDNATGKNKGFCHIDFATKEAQEAALAMSNTEFLGRNIRLDSADGANRQRTKKDENYGPKTNKVFCANLNRDFDEEAHRKSLNENFGKFGKIVDIRIPYDRESGAMKGIAYIEFENPEQAEAAVTGMNGVEVNGRPLRTDYSGSNDRDRVQQRGGRGGRGGFRGGRGGRGGNRGGRGGFRGNTKKTF